MDYSYFDNEKLNCRCCGGVLKVRSSLCECDYCGATNFISLASSKYTNQLNRANKLRQEREFDNAARIYDVILEENGPSSDILWLRTLCEYGIEYVPDPVSDKYIPTLHRIKDESILSYQLYSEALSLADEEQKTKLREEAEYINKVQDEYLHIAENEAPYDVFICYKETDEDTGEQTEDVGLAEQLYKDLSGRGFKVFFAKETLKNKLSVDYEPYIFAALKSSKAMVVLGTKPEYFSSVWVKNEWGRFLRLMQNDENKQMFFACDDPEELPRAFASKQAQLLGEKNAISNLAKNVERFLTEKRGSSYVYDRDKLYEKAVSYLNSGDKTETLNVINNLIDLFPDFAQGYWLRMLYTNNAKPSNITEMQLDITQDPDYYMAVSLAEGDLKEEYKKTAEICLSRVINQRDFNKLLKEKAADYVNNFEESESAQKKNELIDNLIGSEEVFNYFFNRSRWSSAIGYMLIILGAYVFAFSNLAISELQYQYTFLRTEEPRRFLTVRILVSVPFVLAGAVILLSCNLVLDIITTAVTALFMMIPAITQRFGVLYALALALPLAVYIFNKNAVFTVTKKMINKYMDQMTQAALSMRNDLEDLHKAVSIDASAEINKKAEILLEQFKEENEISFPLEISEDCYSTELEKLNEIYESARICYAKYIEVVFPPNEEYERFPKKDSVLSMISIFLSAIPIVGALIAVIDLLNDKYSLDLHRMSVYTIMVSTIMAFAMVLVSNLLY